MNITDTLGQVKALEAKAKQARDTQLSTTKIDHEMLENNVENARRKVEFKEPLHREEHFREIFHPRILYRVNTTSVYELYIATAALPADTKIPTQDYDFQHLSGIGIQISPKGWLYAHRPDLPGFDISFYANIDVASMKFDEATTMVLWEDPKNSSELSFLGALQGAVENHRTSRHRAAPVDFSLEPIIRHLHMKNWYLHLHVERGYLSPTNFCARGYNLCVRRNAFRFKTRKRFLDIDEVGKVFKEVSDAVVASGAKPKPPPPPPQEPASRVNSPARNNKRNIKRQNSQGSQASRRPDEPTKPRSLLLSKTLHCSITLVKNVTISGYRCYFNNKAHTLDNNKSIVRFCANFQTVSGCELSENGGISCNPDGRGPYLHQCNKWLGKNQQCRKAHCRDIAHAKKE